MPISALRSMTPSPEGPGRLGRLAHPPAAGPLAPDRRTVSCAPLCDQKWIAFVLPRPAPAGKSFFLFSMLSSSVSTTRPTSGHTSLHGQLPARADLGAPLRSAPLHRATRTLLIPICCLTIDEPAQCHASPLLERAPGPYGAHESTPSLADPAPIGARSCQWRAVTRRSSRGLWPLECPACSINDGRVRPPYALDRSGLVRAKAIQGVMCVTGSAQIEGTRHSAIGSAGTLRHGSNPHPAPSANPAPRSSLLAPRSGSRPGSPLLQSSRTRLLPR